MSIMKVLSVFLIIIGAIMAFFVRSIIKGQINKIDTDDDDDFGQLLSMSASVFIIIGLAVITAGIIMFFYNN